MRLNVGCGPVKHSGFINLDIGVEFGPDVVGDARRLPFRDEAFDHIVAEDVLEHFPRYQALAALGEWHRVLRPEGTLELRVPNLHGLAAHVAYWHDKDPDKFSVVVENIYGGHKYGPDGAWDTHHWGYSPTSLRCVLDGAGFDTLSNNEALNMTVTARKR